MSGTVELAIKKLYKTKASLTYTIGGKGFPETSRTFWEVYEATCLPENSYIILLKPLKTSSFPLCRDNFPVVIKAIFRDKVICIPFIQNILADNDTFSYFFELVMK